jgi:hypothetical protein
MSQPTKEQRLRHIRLHFYGCVLCKGHASVHHAETGMGGRKDHDKVFPLCFYHHQGEEGIHTLGRKVWQEKYGSEQHWMEIVSHV